jgi:hypothetical protein
MRWIASSAPTAPGSPTPTRSQGAKESEQRQLQLLAFASGQFDGKWAASWRSNESSTEGKSTPRKVSNTIKAVFMKSST